MAEPTPEEAAFVEEAALIYEQMGMPRMAGRLIGWLLISEPAQQSQAELAQALQASKGSISTMTRMLEGFGVLERVTLPGDRLEYVRLVPEAIEDGTGRKLKGIAMFRALAARGLTLLESSPPERSARLQTLHDFYEFLEREMPALFERWKAEKAARAALRTTGS